jgi:hypothetical protein
MGVKIWNCLPRSIRNLNKSTFKKKCKRMLLEILNTCDDYVDLAYIIMQTASTVLNLTNYDLEIDNLNLT